MIKLTRDQIGQIMIQEVEFQLTVMKQYLKKEEVQAYILLLHRYGSLIDVECVLKKYKDAWGTTYEFD